MGRPRENHIYTGDCLDIMAQWDDDCFDHCITDPPYNMSRAKGLAWAFSSHVTMQESWDRFTHSDYVEFCRRWISEICRLVKPNGNIFLFGSFHNIYILGSIVQSLDLRVVNSIVWFKPNAQPNITCRMFTESTEHIIWACNNSPQKARNWVFHYDVARELAGGKQMRNLWEIPLTPPSEKLHGKHPTQKAEAVLERIIRICTNPGDLILDCFGGAGTTGVVAQRLERRWVMIEKDPKYVAISRKRLAAGAASPPAPLRPGEGKTAT